jgi:hypothetical protein
MNQRSVRRETGREFAWFNYLGEPVYKVHLEWVFEDNTKMTGGFTFESQSGVIPVVDRKRPL